MDAHARFDFHAEIADHSIREARFEQASQQISQMHQAAWEMSDDDAHAAFERIAELRDRME